MYKRTALHLFSVLLTLMFMLGAAGPASAVCSDAIGCINIASGDPIHIAYLLATSIPLGQDEVRGVELAIDDLDGAIDNVDGQILGHNILFDGQDGLCTNPGGSAAAQILDNDATIVGVIGTTCSNEAIGGMSYLSTAGFSVISPSNTSQSLTKSGDPNNYPGYLRTSWNDNIQGEAAAEFVKNKLGVSTAAIVDNGGAYSVGIANTFEDEFISLGGTVTHHLTIDPNDTSNIDTQLATIATGSPALLYMPVFSSPEGAYIIDNLPAGLSGVYLLGADGLIDLDVNATSNENGVMLTNLDFSANYNPDYVSRLLPGYQFKYGGPPTGQFHLFAYDAFMILKEAIVSTAVVNLDGSITIGRQALRDALYGTSNHNGMTGSITCGTTGDCASSDLSMAVYKFETDNFTPKYFWPSKVGLVMDAQGINDMGFNYNTYQGLEQAQTNFNIPISLYMPDPSGYQSALIQCADEGSGLCFAVGFSMGDAVAAAASSRPGTSFAILDYLAESAPDNLRSIIFDEKQSGYLAGALAGKMTSTNVVGVVGGMEIPPVIRFAEGYRNGAQCANMNVDAHIIYTGSFVNPTLGANTAEGMINDLNADVIFGAAGITGNGAILYSAQNGVWSIGVDTDQYLSVFEDGAVSGSDKILTSALKRLDQAVITTTNDFLNGGFASPAGTITFNLDNNGVGLAPYHETLSSIPAPVQTYITDLKQDIINNVVNIDDTCRLIISGDADTPDATITYTDGVTPKTTMTDASGLYEISVPPNWSGTVTPSKNAHQFTPVNRTYTNVTTDQSAQNFTPVLTINSSAAEDGWILEKTETSGKGGTKNNTSPTLYIGDDAGNKQYRSILSFDTTLPPNAVITKVTLKIKKAGVAGGGNPITTFGGLLTEIKKGTFGTSALAASDFNTAATKTYGPFKPALTSGWYVINLNTAKTKVNTTGITQIRLRFNIDDNNNSLANYLKLYSGNSPLASRPQLIITYYVIAVP